MTTLPYPTNDTIPTGNAGVFGPSIIVTENGVSQHSQHEFPSSCQTCEVLINGADSYVTLMALETSKTACVTCDLFFCLVQQSFKDLEIESIVTWKEHSTVFGLEATLVDGETQRVILAECGENRAAQLPWLPNLKKSPFTRSPAQDIALVRNWIQDCHDNHPTCRSTELPLLPTRVVYVGNGSIEPRLFTPQKGYRDRYLTLSHRWGTPGQAHTTLITTISNLASHSNAIPLHSLPKTFRDAVEITQSLGFQYVWIDSLCIVQDDVLDWQRESSKMGDIYSRSSATIFAEAAAHCDEGIFQSEADRQFRADAFLDFRHQDRNTGIEQRILVSLGRGLKVYPNSVQQAFCSVDMTKSQLQDRGWILQEEILSRRKVCFGATELHWLCNELSTCECGEGKLVERSLAKVYDPTSKLLRQYIGEDGTVARNITISGSVRGENERDPNMPWRRLVQFYTRRELTKYEDRLPALAGVAASLGYAQWDYLAGLWRRDLDNQLLWARSSNTRESHRLATDYGVPSWSWAQITGQIHFSKPTTRVKWTIRGHSAPAMHNSFGFLPDGWLRIQGLTAPIRLSLFEQPAVAPEQQAESRYRQRAYNGKQYRIALSVMNQKTQGIIEIGKEHATMWFDLDTLEDWHKFVYIDTDGTPQIDTGPKDLVFLLASLVPSGYRSPDEGYCFPLGLVLRRVSQDRWERVTLLQLPHIWRHFSDHMVKESLTLV